MTSGFKILAKDCCKKTLSLTGAYDWRHRGKVSVLMYHRVLPPAELRAPRVQASLVVSTEAFERNMRLLRKRYTPISFDEYFARAATGEWARDERYAIVTFDDGWSDNYFHAFPILAEYHIPATIFMCTGHIGTQRVFWWQAIGDAVLDAYRYPHHRRVLTGMARRHGMRDDQAFDRVFQASDAHEAARRTDGLIERLKLHPPRSLQRFADDCAAMTDALSGTMAMTWAQIKEMSAHGIAFGAHAVNHYRLTALSPEDAAREIFGAAELLEARDGINYTPVFAYPNGDNDDRIRELVRQAGFRAAVTTQCTITSFHPYDRYRLPRIDIAGHVAASNLLYKLKLSGTAADPPRATDSGDRV